MSLRNRDNMLPDGSKGFFAAALLSLTLSAPIALAQQPSQPAPAPVQSSPGIAPAPGQPSQPADSPPGTPISPIERGTQGTYTLRQNAYEVRLNVTVLDGSGRSVQTLDKDAFHLFATRTSQSRSAS